MIVWGVPTRSSGLWKSLVEEGARVAPDKLCRPVFGNASSRIPKCRDNGKFKATYQIAGRGYFPAAGTCGRAGMLFSPFTSPPKTGSKDCIALTLQLPNTARSEMWQSPDLESRADAVSCWPYAGPLSNTRPAHALF